VERKNGWQLAEALEHSTPYSLQHLLDRAPWDGNAVRDDLPSISLKNWTIRMAMRFKARQHRNHDCRFKLTAVINAIEHVAPWSEFSARINFMLYGIDFIRCKTFQYKR
jgi:hypothetical protein